MPDDAIENFIKNGARVLTGLSLGINFPNKLSAPHMIVNQFKNLLAIGLHTGYHFKELKEALSAKAAAPTKTEGGEEEKVEEVVEEEPAQISAGGLFDDDSSSDEE